MRRDLVFALRQFARAPFFAIAVVLCIGVGASATVFSWMEGLVLHPLPAIRDVDRLVTIRAVDRQSGRSPRAASIPEYGDWQDHPRSVSGVAATSEFMFGVQVDAGWDEGRAEPLYGLFASANYFEVLGIRPALGRGFTPADDERGAPPVVVVSHQLWETRLGAAPDVVGRRILVNSYPTTIVGVAPAGFGGTSAGVNFELWVPLRARATLVPSEAVNLDSRTFRWLGTFARLAPGADRARAATEFGELGRRMASAYPEDRDETIQVLALDTGPAEQLAPLFWALIGLTMLVVLIVCSNVANLLLVRAAARSREIGVRLSLGATRGRLVRQLMTESTVLAVIVFGLAPAFTASRVQLADVLKNGGWANRRARSRTRHSLVVAQFALSLTALVCAALFVKRSAYLRDMDRGFVDPEHVLLVQTNMSFAGYPDPAEWQRTVDAVVDRLNRLPGVRAASAATFVPLGFMGPPSSDVTVDGYVPRLGESALVALNGVAPGYFGLMGIPILHGRAVTAEDVAERQRVAVVNEAAARRFWPGTSPLGRHITRRDVVNIFVGESLRVLAVSVTAGAILALGVTTLLHRALGFIPLPDARAVLVPVGILSGVALLAGFVPARRSAEVDVANTLRAE